MTTQRQPPSRRKREQAQALEVSEERHALTMQASDDGYWEQRGYDVDAWVGASNGGRQDPTS